jgi:hypothetical protein
VAASSIGVSEVFTGGALVRVALAFVFVFFAITGSTDDPVKLGVASAEIGITGFFSAAFCRLLAFVFACHLMNKDP